jgi:thioredoxin 1
MAKSKTSRNLSKKKRKRNRGRSGHNRGNGSGGSNGSNRSGGSNWSGRLKANGPVLHVNSQAVFDELVMGEKPVIVDFWADWCGPCKLMGPIFETVARQFGDQVNFVKVDTERAPVIAGAFGIRSIPTIIALHRGEVIDSHVGLVAEEGLSKMARRALDKAQGVTLGDKVKRLFRRGGAEANSESASELEASSGA